MSIINEALKKTGEFIQENETKNKPAAKIFPSPKLLLVYFLILLAGILLSKFIFDLLSRPQERTLASDSRSAPLQSPKAASVEPSVKPVLPTAVIAPLENKNTAEPSFILNGIFFSDNDGYALVNNQIVRENDSVDGATVARITQTTVELDSNGELTSLSTRR
ncbi:MAG: hypothetical protein COV71_01645 [Candidatus Omnitrophica bacterium CG11_big_fil_rev_8_21_14_0_20_41_12]|nr:MAG: hypothetical protein COV71_01645 [Candidatus Omnitrophica bacterium CG11_big_fil_rev_8_21_14_0_20_41_12]